MSSGPLGGGDADAIRRPLRSLLLLLLLLVSRGVVGDVAPGAYFLLHRSSGLYLTGPSLRLHSLDTEDSRWELQAKKNNKNKVKKTKK